jgi:hypothetical protein
MSEEKQHYEEIKKYYTQALGEVKGQSKRPSTIEAVQEFVERMSDVCSCPADIAMVARAPIDILQWAIKNDWNEAEKHVEWVKKDIKELEKCTNASLPFAEKLVDDFLAKPVKDRNIEDLTRLGTVFTSTFIADFLDSKCSGVIKTYLSQKGLSWVK